MVVSLGTSAPRRTHIQAAEADSTVKEVEVAVHDGLRMQDPISGRGNFQTFAEM